MLAPAAFDVIWTNLDFIMGSSGGSFYWHLGTILSVVGVFLYMLLILGISFLASLESWIAIFPDIKVLADWTIQGYPVGAFALTLFTGTAPSAFTSLVRLVMPYVIQRSLYTPDLNLIATVFSSLRLGSGVNRSHTLCGLCNA